MADQHQDQHSVATVQPRWGDSWARTLIFVGLAVFFASVLGSVAGVNDRLLQVHRQQTRGTLHGVSFMVTWPPIVQNSPVSGIGNPVRLFVTDTISQTHDVLLRLSVEPADAFILSGRDNHPALAELNVKRMSSILPVLEVFLRPSEGLVSAHLVLQAATVDETGMATNLIAFSEPLPLDLEPWHATWLRRGSNVLLGSGLSLALGLMTFVVGLGVQLLKRQEDREQRELELRMQLQQRQEDREQRQSELTMQLQQRQEDREQRQNELTMQLQQRQEDREQEELERAIEINLQGVKEAISRSVLHGVERYVMMRKSTGREAHSQKEWWNDELESLQRRLRAQPWEQECLRGIEDALEQNDTVQADEILEFMADFEADLPDNSRQRSRPERKWRQVHQVFRAALDTASWPDHTIGTCLALWDDYDVEARSLVVRILDRYLIRPGNVDWPTLHGEFSSEPSTHEAEKKMQARRRLLRYLDLDHSDVPKDFRDRRSLGTYIWPNLFVATPQPATPDLRKWLESAELARNPFGPHKAEFETDLDKLYFLPDRWKWLLGEQEGRLPVWIYGQPGSGRTALGLYLTLQARERKDFAMFVRWRPPLGDSRMIVDDVMLAICRQAATTWLQLLAHHPGSLLDLPQRPERHWITSLLKWYFGGSDIACLADLSRQWAGQDLTKGSYAVLNRRLKRNLPQLTMPEYLREGWVISWLATRPAHTRETQIALEVTAEVSVEVGRALLDLAERCRAAGVYIKILAPSPSPASAIVTLSLDWAEEDLRKMIAERVSDGSGSKTASLFAFFEGYVDADTVLAEAAQGSPQRLIQLGNTLLERHVTVYRSGQYLLPANLLTILDT